MGKAIITFSDNKKGTLGVTVKFSPSLKKGKQPTEAQALGLIFAKTITESIRPEIAEVLDANFGGKRRVKAKVTNG